MKLYDLLDLNLLAKMEAEKFVSRRRHPELPLSILNYTDKAQYDREWNPVTRQCRGLIINDDKEIIARPFPKFFNLSEHPPNDPLIQGPFSIEEKLDGSLGILWKWDGYEGVASRGSFESPQAQWATRWWSDNGFKTPEGVTLLFEIIYPENRIVVNYGDRAELVFLKSLHIETGLPHPLSVPISRAKTYSGTCTPEEVVKLDPKGEGFVLYFSETNTRVKVKHEEYTRLHKLMSMASPKAVWEMLMAGEDPYAIAAKVPDEFHAWLRATTEELSEAYQKEYADALLEFMTLRNAIGMTADRKTFAEKAKNSPRSAMLFQLLDGKDIRERVWKAVKPESSKPFIGGE